VSRPGADPDLGSRMLYHGHAAVPRPGTPCGRRSRGARRRAPARGAGAAARRVGVV